MELDRRTLLGGAAALLGGSLLGACRETGDPAGSPAERPAAAADPRWREVRALFDLDPELVHMSAMLISSHPRPVREAIERYRRELDGDPVATLEEHNEDRQEAALGAAADYLGARSRDVALTDSTTMGLGLVYSGLALEPGDEILTTRHDYYATHEALRLAAVKTGARVREVVLYDDVSTVTPDEIVARLLAALSPATRVLALTWVHSGTGLELPIAAVAAALRRRERSGERHVLLCVDGVHAFGVEDFDVTALGCDFFVAGAHKWLFGPRGTGIVWGSERAWRAVQPTIPTFLESASWYAWARNREPPGDTNARRFSPGGFKPFEHQWAMKDAFELHLELGKERVAERTHELAGQLKEGLAGMRHVELITPRAPELSAGIVCFDVAGMGPERVVARLRERGVVATVTPYATPHARLSPSIRNSAAEVDAALAAVAALA